MFHDPTTRNRQENDVWTQYASAIFYGNEQQKQIAQKVKNELQQAITNGGTFQHGYQRSTVQTGVFPYTTFHVAHQEHQQYLMKNPRGYCNHRLRFKTWPKIINTNGNTNSTHDDGVKDAVHAERKKKPSSDKKGGFFGRRIMASTISKLMSTKSLKKKSLK